MSYLPGSLYSFVTVTSTPTPQIVANRIAYVCKGASTLNFMLPASSLAGFSFKVIGKTCNWIIGQNANQSIATGILTTNTGITGNLSSTFPTDQVEVTCFTANLEYEVTQNLGNLTVT